MKTLILILILLSLLQTTILPFNLVLIILICRAYLKNEKTNLYLAFGFGIFISHLELNNLGLVSIIYLAIIQLTQMLSKSQLAGHFLLIVPISFIFLSILNFHQLFPKVIIESLISLPILFLIKIWEERFIAGKDIRLRL